MTHKRMRGFTLLELLAVITIIGILATLAAIGIANASRRARDARRQTDLTNIKTALMLYEQDNGSFPATLSVLTDTTNTTTYIPSGVLPSDPAKKVPYNVGGTGIGSINYTLGTGSTDFVLSTPLEYLKAKSTVPSNVTSCTDVTQKGNGVLAGAAPCYRVTND
jgi:prepilin-type N-terminal cleavage/methylation domain-containing protein